MTAMLVTSDSNVIVLTDNVTMVTEVTDAVEEDVGFDDDDCDASKLSDINVGFQEEKRSWVYTFSGITCCT